MSQLVIINSASVNPKKIVLISPRYAYGKDQIFLGGSIVSIAARLMAMGHMVRLIDLNIDRLGDSMVQQCLRSADVIGLSLTGSVHIPGAIALVASLFEMNPSAKILVGGQVVERLQVEQFNKLFDDHIIQVRGVDDLARVLGCSPTDVPTPEAISYIPVWQQMGEERLSQYLHREGTLVVSQGCHFHCKFCAASKAQREVFRDFQHFESDIRYLAGVAKKNGIRTLEFYASSLDFFQNPKVIQEYLEVLARVQEENDIRIRLRCLSCMVSFLHAVEMIPNFENLARRAGLSCIGFGVDGTDETVWKAQKKGQNNTSDVLRSFGLCQTLGIRAELLTVFGFPEDTFFTLAMTVATSVLAVIKWPGTVVRPYLAKRAVPGNIGWQEMVDVTEAVMADPQKFYNLDFCAIGSPLTHPDWRHRWLCNTAYLTICALLTPFGKCATYPLLPQGEGGIYGRVAKLVNRLMPFDR